MRYQQDPVVQERCVLGPRLRLGPLAGVVVVLAACVVSTGCRRSPNYIPSAKTGRQALEAALTAWVNGQRIGPIESASPPIQVVDSAWWKGQRLASFEILSEETSKEGLPCFSVRLHKSRPQGDETVRYLVTGQSPVWVYREEDYKSSQSWEGYKYR